MLKIGKSGSRYIVDILPANINGTKCFGDTLCDAIRLAYHYDRRVILRAEQDRVAREYRARCAEQDTKKDRSVST